MDLDCDNYREGEVLFEKHMQTCDFIAMDLEMTGIKMEGEAMGAGDLVPVRYERCKRVVENFGIVQCGLCLFEYDENDELIARPFNFYLFPRSIEEQKCFSSPSFALDASSMEFLRQQKMDFGRWISKGITYVNRDVDEHLRQMYDQQTQEEDNQTSNEHADEQWIDLSRPKDKK